MRAYVAGHDTALSCLDALLPADIDYGLPAWVLHVTNSRCAAVDLLGLGNAERHAFAVYWASCVATEPSLKPSRILWKALGRCLTP